MKTTAKKPNMLILWGDDIGTWNISFNNRERADESSNTYWDWVLDHAFVLVPVQAYVKQLMDTLQAFPPRQKSASFNLDRVMEELTVGGVSSH